MSRDEKDLLFWINNSKLKSLLEKGDEIIFCTDGTRWFGSSVYNCGSFVLTNRALIYLASCHFSGVRYMDEVLMKQIYEYVFIKLDCITEIKRKSILFVPNRLWIATSSSKTLYRFGGDITDLNSKTVYRFGGMKLKKREELYSLLKERCNIIDKE